MERTAEEKFDLRYITEVTAQGQDWVIYEDGVYRSAVRAEDWHAPVPSGMDYFTWYRRVRTAGNHDLCRKIATEAGCGINAAGDCALITP